MIGAAHILAITAAGLAGHLVWARLHFLLAWPSARLEAVAMLTVVALAVLFAVGFDALGFPGPELGPYRFTPDPPVRYIFPTI